MLLQIDFVICLANTTSKANIIYWFLIKYKRVTCSVLAFELYRMAHGFDIGAVIKTIIEKIFRSAVLLILCTNSKSLYNCLVRLGTTKEQQLMVDVISLHQSYKQQKIIEVKQIYGYHKLADSMLKAKLLSALKTLIDSNCINISTME